MKKNVFYIPRELETAIELYRNPPEIIAIIGTRQCGKTTLMQHIMQGIKGKRVRIFHSRGHRTDSFIHYFF